MADFASVPDDVWPEVLPRVRAAGIEVSHGEPERGVLWFACTREAARIELGYSPSDRGREVVLYTPTRRFWRRPVRMRWLIRDVRRAVLTAGGRLA